MNYSEYLDDDGQKKKKENKNKEKEDKKQEKYPDVILEEKDSYQDYQGEIEKEEIDDRLVERKVKVKKNRSIIFYNIMIAIFTILIIFVIILLFFPNIID